MKTLLIIILFSNVAFAQITGKIITPKREAVPFVNVLLLAASDSSLVSGTTTNEGGNYQLLLPKMGRFYLKISGVGYQTRFSEAFDVNASKSTIALADLTLMEEENTLNEVQVSAKKELVQTTPLGKIINVQSSLMTKGSNALQVLERLPGVISDRRNNQFSLNGQSGGHHGWRGL